MQRSAFERDASIEIHRINGESKVTITGDGQSLLVLLAGLEKSILQKMGCDQRTFNKVKKLIGIENLEEE